MRDLFGSTNFITFGVVETILSSSDAVDKLLHGEETGILEKGYTLDDYLSNIDSYLYGLLLLPIDNIDEVKIWIKNYILYLFIPLIEKSPLYIVKSRFICEIFKLNDSSSRIQDNIREFILEDLYKYLDSSIKSKEDEVKESLLKYIDQDVFIDYIVNYFYIYSNKMFIQDVYISNERLRDDLKSLFEFLK